MSLPPLPAHPWRLAPIWDEDEQKVLQAYGQSCRAAALEEAARICHSIATAPSNVVLGVAMECYEKIRSLK